MAFVERASEQDEVNNLKWTSWNEQAMKKAIAEEIVDSLSKSSGAAEPPHDWQTDKRANLSGILEIS